MRIPLRFVIIVALLARTIQPGTHEVKIIANASVKLSRVTAEELRRVFLIKTNSLRDGSPVEPVLGLGSPAHGAFLKQYLGKTDAALNTYYRSLVFTGKAFMPKLLASDAEVVAYVSKTKGAVGYVSAETETGGVKSLFID
jgi:hypothetical protein